MLENIKKAIILFLWGITVSIFLLAILLCQSCSILSPVKIEPIKNYLLMTPVSENDKNKMAMHRSNKILLISKISTVPWLNTSQMAYQINDNQINYFALNQWTAAPADMLQLIITQSLASSGQFGIVVSDPYNGNYDKRIDIKLLEFQQIFMPKTSIYHVTLQVRLFDNHLQKTIRAKIFEFQMPCHTNNPQGGVAAANQIIKILMTELRQFIVYG